MSAGNGQARHARAGPASDPWRLAESVLGIAVLVASVAFIAIFLWIARYRIPFPFELEWVEGSILLQAQRILSGEALYVAPSLYFVPVTYPPVYQYLSAAACALTELSYTPLRLISAAATLGVFGLLFRYVQRETGSGGAGLAAAGLFAASFRASGAWFDTAHVDSLHLLFQLMAVYLARFASSWRGQLGCGVLIALAFLTKQSGLAAGAALLVASSVLHGRRAVPAIASATLLAGGATLWLHWGSDGWYGYYLFGQYVTHGFVQRMWLAFWTEDLARQFGPATILALVATGWQLLDRDRRSFFFYAFAGGGMLAMAYSSRVHLGGYDNVLMPIHAWIALLAGLALAVHVARDAPPDAARSGWRRSAPALLQLLCLAQFAQLAYDPKAQIPTPADLDVGRRLVAFFEGVDGEIFLPSRNYLPVAAGKPPTIHATAMYGIFSDPRIEESRELQEEFQRALREQRYALIVSGGHEPYQKELDRYYRLRPSLFTADDRDAFWPLTGLQTRPHLFYVPRGELH